VTASIVRLEEDITRGQDIARYAVLGSDGGDWQPLSKGTTVGYAKIDRFASTAVQRVKVVVEDALAPPRPIALKLFVG
jgi:alpha-L-fucosidase